MSIWLTTPWGHMFAALVIAALVLRVRRMGDWSVEGRIWQGAALGFAIYLLLVIMASSMGDGQPLVAPASLMAGW